MGLEADGHDLEIHADRPGADISPTMYGLFFEDINYAADGGLYAEKIKNRSFEFPQNFMGWQTFGGIELRDDGPFERNPHYVRLSAAGHPEKHSGLINEGFFGIGIGRGEEYRFSVWARVPEGGSSKLVVQIASQSSRQESQEIASATITIDSKEWKKYTAVLKSDVTDTHACLRIFLAKPDNGDDDTHDGLDEVTVDVEHVSLFPVNTWKGQENGLRADLAQALYDIRPGVLRFPGGCVVEGTDLGTRYQWKNTVGPVENRPLNENRWHYTFTYRFFPTITRAEVLVSLSISGSPRTSAPNRCPLSMWVWHASTRTPTIRAVYRSTRCNPTYRMPSTLSSLPTATLNRAGARCVRRWGIPSHSA